MNRAEATDLLQKYREFPYTNLFSTKPFNYPLFHLLECFSKGWNICRLQYDLSKKNNHWSLYQIPFNIDFEKLGRIQREGDHVIWSYVARNPGLPNTKIGFVQEDLFCRYVGRCNPLKLPTTSWTFISLEQMNLKPDWSFKGKIGKYTNLYLIELNLDLVDIVGEIRKDLPWHYLQQTIEWKPFKSRIEWQQENEQQENENV